MVKHIEFIGIPGSGKTTLKKLVIEKLKQSDFEVFTFEKAVDRSNMKKLTNDNCKLKRLFYIIGTRRFSSFFRYTNFQVSAYNEFLLNNTSLVEQVANILNSKEIGKEGKNAVMGWVFDIFSGHQIINNNLFNNEIVVCDEGFCHRTVAIWGRDEKYKFDKAEVSKYLSLIPLPQILFFVKAPVEKCEERLTNRGYLRILKGLDHEERVKRLYFIEEIMNYVISILKDKGVKVVYLDNMKDGDFTIPEDIIRETKELLESK